MEKILRLFLYTALFTPLFVFTSLFFPYVTSKILSFEGLALGAFLIWLYLWYAHPETYAPRITWLTVSLALYILIQFIAALQGVNFWRSFWSTYERMDGVFIWISLFLFFIVIGSFQKRKKYIQLLLQISLLTNTIIVVEALNFFGIRDGAIALPMQISAVFNSPIYLGVYAFFHAVFALLLFWPFVHKKSYAKIFYAISFFLNILVVFLTFSRGVFVGLSISLAVFLLWYFFNANKKRFILKIGAAVFIVIVISFPFWKNSSFTHRIYSIGAGDESRFLQWRTGFHAFLSKPILGFGPYNYFTAQNKFFEPSLLQEGFDKIHNKYIEVLVDSGIIGFLSYSAIFGLLFFQLFRARKKEPFETALLAGSLAGYLAQNVTAFDNPGSYLPLFLLLAFINSKFFNPLHFKLKPKPLLVVSCWLLAVGFLWRGVWQPWQENTALAQTLVLQQKKEKDYSAIFEGYKETLSYASLGDYETRLQLGVFIANNQGISQEFLNFGIHQLEEESEISKEDVTVRIILAKLYEQKGFKEKKQEFLKKSENELLFAINLSPSRPETYEHYTVFLLNQNKGKEARDNLMKIETISPKTFEQQKNQWYLGLSYFVEKNFTQARAIFERIQNKGGSFSQANEFLVLAKTAFGVGDYKEMLGWYKKLYDIDGNNPQYNIYLAAAYKKVGDKAHAQEYAKRVLEIDPRLASEVNEFIESLK